MSFIDTLFHNNFEEEKQFRKEKLMAVCSEN